MKKILKFIIYILIFIILFIVITNLVNNNSNIDRIETNDFTLTYVQEEKTELKKILDKNISKLYDYNIYTYGGNVLIEINNIKYDFKEALEKQIITIDMILNKAKEDSQNQICIEEKVYDGGSIQYRYSNYTLLKYHDLNGKEDFVIGMKRWNYPQTR